MYEDFFYSSHPASPRLSENDVRFSASGAALIAMVYRRRCRVKLPRRPASRTSEKG